MNIYKYEYNIQWKCIIIKNYQFTKMQLFTPKPNPTHVVTLVLPVLS